MTGSVPIEGERVPNVDERLDRVRGAAPPRRHNARTIAALTTNPGCRRRAVLDCAGVDKPALAAGVGFPAQFGQSRFAISRGNAFEARVKADGGAELLRLLGERLGLPIPEADYADLSDISGDAGNEVRHSHSRARLTGAAAQGVPDQVAALFDHPLLRLEVAGRRVFLEPDLIVGQFGGRFHVVEIKSFAVIDGQADSSKLSAAATQAAVYVLALRDLLAEAGHDPQIVSHDVLLVCPRDFSTEPTAELIDVRRQLLVLRRQLARMARVDELLARLPTDLTFDLAPDPAGTPTRPPLALRAALKTIEARYAPECLAACELARFCRHEAAGQTAALGKSVREALGGVELVSAALALAAGESVPAAGEPAPAGGGSAEPEPTEAATLLRAAARLRTEVLS